MLAACHNLPSLLQLLLTPPATAAAYPPQLGPNAASRKGHHALCYAAMGGHITCLALLLTHAAGGSPHNYQQALQSQSAPCGHSPLHHAVKALHLKAARWLVGRGAGANARIRPSPSLYQAHGARLRTPRQLEEERATALHCAVRVYLRVKEAQQLLKLAGPGAVVAAGGWDGEGEEEEGEAAGCGGGGLVVGLRKGVGGAKCKAGLKEREERAFKLIRWLVEEGRANLLARDARGRTALEMVMTSPLYQRPTLLGSAVSSFSFSSPSSALLSGGGGGSEQPLRDGAGSLESTPTRPARNGGGGRGLGLRPFSLSSAASDPGGAGGSGSGARIKRSLSIASLFSRASSSFRVGRARSRGWSWRSSGKGLGGEEGAEEVTAAAAAVAATPPTAVVPLMGRAISGGGASSLSLTGLAAAAAGGTLASSSGAGAGAATSVRKVAKYLALMQRKQRAVSACVWCFVWVLGWFVGGLVWGDGRRRTSIDQSFIQIGGRGLWGAV